ncbi:MAG: hypothetical protein SFW07_00715, partial [Gammaproteobacteria bacterium]|nr:hypothetical protein [Gammaproteobacteria bacterium]
KLKTRYPKNDKAEKRFARFFLWHCKKEDLDPKAAAERYHSFLHQHGLYTAFTNYLDVYTQYPLIETRMYSEDFCARTKDSATVVTHQTLSFGEDMTQDEKHNLLLNLNVTCCNVTCCFANQSGIKIKTTGTDQAFFVTRNNNQLLVSKFDHPIQGMVLDQISAEREVFVILVSGDAPTSTEEMKALLTKHALSTQKLSEKLAGEISTENGKAPITISILPIDRNSKKLHYAAHIPGESLERTKEFKQRLEALPNFDRYKKLKEEVEQLIQKTERYFAKLNDEIESEKESFLASHPHSSVTYGYQAWKADDNRVPTEMNISNVNTQDNTIFNNTIGEKAKLRFEVSQSLKKLKSNYKTALEKMQEFSQNLFKVEAAAEPALAEEPAAVAKPTLAKRIENTKTGFDYLKDIVSIIASGVAFISLVGIIPMIAYRYKAHKWLWESNRGNFLDEAQKAKEMQETTFPRAPVAAA